MDSVIPRYEDLTTRQDVVFSGEYDVKLYVRLPPKHHYDETVWKADKKTKQVSPVHLVDFFAIRDRVKYIKKPDWEK